MKTLSIAAIAAISIPMMTKDAMAFFWCDHHPAAESSGRYANNENSINWWKAYGTDIGGELDQGTNVFTGGADLGFNLDRLFPNAVGQVSGQFAHANSEDWSFRTKLGSVSLGQNDNFGAGGGWAITAGVSEYDFNSSAFDQEIDGRFVALQAHCFIGNDYRLTGQIGRMRLDDDFREWDVDFVALKGDVWFNDHTAAHGVVSYAESDTANEEEALQLAAGIKWQPDSTKPFVVGAELSYMNVEDRTNDEDLWTASVTVQLMSLGNTSNPPPTLREFSFHSSHIWGTPPGTAFQVR